MSIDNSLSVQRKPKVLADIRGLIRDIVEYRDLLQQLTLRDIRLRYKQAVMGLAWAVLMPALIVVSGLVVRFAMARMSGEPLAAVQIANIALKGIAWAFFAGAMGLATGSLVGNANLVTKIYFPREVLPLSAIGAQLFDSATLGYVKFRSALSALGERLPIN